MNQLFDKFRNPKMHGALRHVLTAFGPLLAAYGWVDDIKWQLGVGVVMACLGFYLSWTAAEKK